MPVMTLQALRENRNVLAKEVRNILDNNPGKEWTPEHQSTYEAKVGEIERIDSELSRQQKVLDLEADRIFKDIGAKETSAEVQTRPLFAKWLRGGDGALNAEEWSAVRNTMSGQPGNGSQGGYTVETDIVQQVVNKLKLFGGMRAVAEVFQTSQGNPLQFPTSDGTAELGELIAENTTATAADPNFGATMLNVYKFSSKVVTVPIELLQDSVIDVEQFVVDRLATRLGRIQNNLFTLGTGTAQPLGIVPAAAAGVVAATGGATTITYGNLVDLTHAVDPAYRQLGRCRFMFHDQTLASIQKIVDSSGRPIFLPGYMAEGATGPAPDRILGYPIQINQDVATMAANAYSALFGDFSFYKIRDVMNMTVFRFTDSAYTKLGQVGFLAWMRSGGTLVDAGGAVCTFKNSAT